MNYYTSLHRLHFIPNCSNKKIWAKQFFSAVFDIIAIGKRKKYFMIKEPKQSIQEHIQEMVRRIVTQFQPESIILFGSHARGDAVADSDIDLLVVMPVKGSKRKARLSIRTALHDIPVAKDVIVSDPVEFKWRKNIVGTIEWPASHEGRVLYAKT